MCFVYYKIIRLIFSNITRYVHVIHDIRIIFVYILIHKHLCTVYTTNMIILIVGREMKMKYENDLIIDILLNT